MADNLCKGPWDQQKFKELLVKWIIATDQPFYTVDEPEFHDLLLYTHHTALTLKIPHRDAVKRRVMKMGEDSIERTKEMFLVCQSLTVIYSCTDSHSLLRTTLMGRSASPLMPGCPATITRSWQSLPIMS